MLALVGCGVAYGQQAPTAANHPWDASLAKPPMQAPAHKPVIELEPSKVYTLPELINVAEQNNPDTRVAWENARGRAAQLGVSKST